MVRQDRQQTAWFEEAELWWGVFCYVVGVVTGCNDQILSYNNTGGSQKNPPLMLSLTTLVKLGKWPTWHTILSMCLFLFLTLCMFRAHRAHHQERQIVSIQPLVAVILCRCPCRLQVGSSLPTCTWHGHWQLPEVVLIQFVSPDDEHDVLETCRELKIKINT